MEAITSQLSLEYLSLTIIGGFAALCINSIVTEQYNISKLITRLSAENNLLLTQNAMARTQTKMDELHKTIEKYRYKINDLEDGIHCHEEEDVPELIKQYREKESTAIDELVELQDHMSNLENNKIEYFSATNEFNLSRRVLELEQIVERQKQQLQWNYQYTDEDEDFSEENENEDK